MVSNKRFWYTRRDYLFRARMLWNFPDHLVLHS